MTMTVKLDALLEQRLRQRSVASGEPASAIIRRALEAFLAEQPLVQPSAYELGKDLFGRHTGGPADLARTRRQTLGEVLEEKHASRARRRGPDGD